VRRSTSERCVKIINGYRETLHELGATEETPIRAVATNVLAEASNQDSFINRIQIGCGLEIETLDEGEMTRLIYLKTRRRLRDTPSMNKRTTLVVHVGPGNTRALLFKNGRISDYSNYRLGVAHHASCSRWPGKYARPAIQEWKNLRLQQLQARCLPHRRSHYQKPRRPRRELQHHQSHPRTHPQSDQPNQPRLSRCRH